MERWVGPAQLFPVSCGSVPNNIYCPVQNPENTSIGCTGNISHVCLLYENSRRRDQLAAGARWEKGFKRIRVLLSQFTAEQETRRSAGADRTQRFGRLCGDFVWFRIYGRKSRRVLAGCPSQNLRRSLRSTFVWCRARLRRFCLQVPALCVFDFWISFFCNVTLVYSELGWTAGFIVPARQSNLKLHFWAPLRVGGTKRAR